MSTDIFNRIFASALSDDSDFPIDDKGRWIARKDEADAKLMAEAKVTVGRLGRREVTALIEFENRFYFAASGYPDPSVMPDELLPISSSPGLFAVMINQANIPSNASASSARQYLQLQYAGVDGYLGHDLSDIEDLFPAIKFYSIENGGQSSFCRDLSRISGSYIIRGYGDYPLELSDRTKNKIRDIFESGQDFFPYSTILRGVLSYSWSSIFLDLYRSIEQLYGAPKIKLLAESIDSSKSHFELSQVLERIMAWRPKEEEALGLLLKETSQPVQEALIDSLYDKNGTKPDLNHTNCASLIYKLRNSHVHFRPAMTHIEMSSESWDDVISAMCDAFVEIYEKFGKEFLTSDLA